MSRQWTRRRQTSLNGEALDPEAFAQAYPLFRADPIGPGAVNKEALGLVLTFVCLALPFHLAMKWLAAFSLPLAAGVGAAVAAGLLVVALARRLGLDGLLRKLPLVLLVVCGAYGLHLLSTVRNEQVGWGGVEWVGLFLLITTVASVAASFYQPAAAAYRTVTQGTPVSTLVTAAAATALSVGVAVLGQAVPLFVQKAVGAVAVFGYAGLVLFEYAAWVKADPVFDLSAHLARVAAAETDYERDELALHPRQGRRFLVGALLAGLCLAVALVTGDAIVLPDSEVPRYFAQRDPETVQEQRDNFARCFMAALLYLGIVILVTSSHLDGMRFPQGKSSFSLAWQPLAVFLSYPDAQHPLAHRLRFRWLRPKSVRLGLTAAVLLLIPSVGNRSSGPSAPSTPAATSPLLSPVTPPPPPERIPPGDVELARVLGVPPDTWVRGGEPPTRAVPPAPAASPAAAPGPPEGAPPPFLAVLFFAVIGPPLAVYATVSLLGWLVLPAYRAMVKEAETQTA